jgi:CDP-6-deoxy-D-xylo-4-hexulose-3-dehydrase
MLFGGNLLRQPAFVQLYQDNQSAFRVAGEMCGADEIMNSTLFLGTYPGLTPQMLACEINVIAAFAAPKPQVA